MKKTYNLLVILIFLLSLTSCSDTKKIEKKNFIIEIPNDMRIPEWGAILDKNIKIKNAEAELVFEYISYTIIVLENTKNELNKKYTINNFINKQIDTLFTSNVYHKTYEEEINDNKAFISNIVTIDSSRTTTTSGDYTYFWKIAVFESNDQFFTILTASSGYHGYFYDDEILHSISSFIIK